MRSFDSGCDSERKDIYNIVKETLINQGIISFGGYATLLPEIYACFSTKNSKKIQILMYYLKNPEKTANIVKEQLEADDFVKVKVIKKDGIGEDHCTSL